MGTSTSPFGVGKREGHDAREFYARFRPPEISTDDTVVAFDPEPALVCGDARHMDDLKDGCVALVVTSPPYYAGKEYEQEVGVGGVPASYLDYLAMLRDVFDECRRVLEPGGRIAVNVANLGRRPYRSLASDVIRILQDDLGLLLRGEIVWVKAEGASGSCAWGSYRSPANPVLRDVSERVIVASKGRFDRARPAARRRTEGLPCEVTVTADEFLESTLDVWHIPPESARRVGHPAPFPVELPQRLIELYTYRGDLVLDPFLGSGSTAVAAARIGRRWTGYDTDPTYVAAAVERVAAETAQARTGDTLRGQDPVDRHQFGIGRVAVDVLTEAGFVDVGAGRPSGAPGSPSTSPLSTPTAPGGISTCRAPSPPPGRAWPAPAGRGRRWAGRRWWPPPAWPRSCSSPATFRPPRRPPPGCSRGRVPERSSTPSSSSPPTARTASGPTPPAATAAVRSPGSGAPATSPDNPGQSAGPTGPNS